MQCKETKNVQDYQTFLAFYSRKRDLVSKSVRSPSNLRGGIIVSFCMLLKKHSYLCSLFQMKLTYDRETDNSIACR